jgi:hypothetical protein
MLAGPNLPPSTFESHVVKYNFHFYTSLFHSTTISLLSYSLESANRILFSLLGVFQSLSCTHTASKTVYLAVSSELLSVVVAVK